MRLPSSLSRPSYIYIILFIVQLLFTITWLATIQREQHHSNDLGASGSGGLNGFVSNRLKDIKCDCPKNILGVASSKTIAAVALADGCAERVTKAILKLEELKSEIYLPPPAPTATNTAVTAITSPMTIVPKKPFLIIGIPSIHRPSVDYLTPVLEALERQFTYEPEDPMFGQIQVWIMNNMKDEPYQSTTTTTGGDGTSLPKHTSWESNKLKYSGRPGQEFRFLTNDHVLQDAIPLARDRGSADAPGWIVRKQTRDIVRLMQVAKGESSYYLAMEDDFEICPNGLRIIEHAIRKAAFAGPNATPDLASWITMKFSYGFNGFMLKNNEDLQEFGRYLLVHQARRPPVSLCVCFSQSVDDS